MPRKSADGRAPSYQGDVDALTTVLAAHIRKPGAIQYAEAPGSRVNRELITPWSEMWQQLVKLQSNLSFSKAVMESALAGVAAQHRFFRKHPGNLASFTKSVGSRLQLMGRHIQQSRLKKARWAYALLALPLPESSEDKEEEEEEEEEEEDDAGSNDGQDAALEKKDGGDTEDPESAVQQRPQESVEIDGHMSEQAVGAPVDDSQGHMSDQAVGDPVDDTDGHMSDQAVGDPVDDQKQAPDQVSASSDEEEGAQAAGFASDEGHDPDTEGSDAAPEVCKDTKPAACDETDEDAQPLPSLIKKNDDHDPAQKFNDDIAPVPLHSASFHTSLRHCQLIARVSAHVYQHCRACLSEMSS